MHQEQLHEILRPDNPATPARLLRGVHHAVTVAGIGVVFAATVEEWREAYAAPIDGAFYLISTFFAVEYVVRLIAAPADPHTAHRSDWQARCDFATSLGGAFDLLGALPGLLHLVIGAP